jgi:hypothetical protein
MAKRKNSNPDVSRDDTLDADSALCAGESNSGGGNASGSPDADTGMSVGDRVIRGNTRQDRKKLFPDRYGTKPTKKTRTNQSRSSGTRARGKQTRSERRK